MSSKGGGVDAPPRAGSARGVFAPRKQASAPKGASATGAKEGSAIRKDRASEPGAHADYVFRLAAGAAPAAGTFAGARAGAFGLGPGACQVLFRQAAAPRREAAAGPLAPGLQVSDPGEPAEVQAEAVAARVMASPDAAGARAHPPLPAAAPTSTASPSADGGSPLSAPERAFFEPRFGRGLDHVRLHTSAEASRSAQALSARAYTLGQHIVFGDGEYAPGTASSQRLLAHELAHVVHGTTSGPPRVMRQQGPAQQPPAQQQTPPQVPVPAPPAARVALTGSVGDGGANAPADVRAVQDRLLALRFLSTAAHAAEAVTVPTPPQPGTTPQPAQPGTTPQPVQPGTVAVTSIPRTMRALNVFALSALGQPLLLIAPGSPLEAALNVTPIAGAGSVSLGGSVGSGGANAVADVVLVQDRLLATGYLAPPDHRTESAAVAAVTGAVPASAIPRTLGALLHVLRDAGRTASQVAPGTPEESALNAPPAYAADAPQVATITLAGTVGAGGANAVGDVRTIQDRLRDLGFLSAAAATAERPGRRATGPVADAAIPQTIVAIARFQDEALGAGVAAPADQIGPGTAGASALNAPPRRRVVALERGAVRITAAVGDGAANNPADVRAVQDRLLAIGLLAPADHAAEQVNVQTATAPVTGIPRTIAAIVRFHREIVRSSLAQIRTTGRDVDLLNEPPRFRPARVEIGAPVGTGGTNAPADVRAVQERLHDLGYLSDAGFSAEAVSSTAGANVAATALVATIAALSSLQTTLGQGRVTVSGLCTPGDMTHRLLIDPRLPPPMTATITGSVGGGGRNNAADVTLVQSRLRELGFLSTVAFLSERPATGTTGRIADAAIPQTIAAVGAFLMAAAGSTGNRLDAGGMGMRVLADPSYGTTTIINPNATNLAAGPPPGTFSHEVQQIISAIEIAEAGRGRGERPATLQNAAGTPASFGKAQLIGGTAVEVLRHNPAFAQVYGLDRAALTSLQNIGANTVTHYDGIFALVRVGGVTEAALQGLISNYVTTNGARFHRETGLFDADITAMFRAAQFRRHIAGATLAQVPNLMNAATSPDAAANIAALGFRRDTVEHYVSVPRHLGENRQGFVTRALFLSQHGQQLRDAMTDAHGIAIGRQLVADDFALMQRRAAALRITLTTQQRAEVTARMHNSGSGNVDAFLRDLPGTRRDPYVSGNFLPNWTP